MHGSGPTGPSSPRPSLGPRSSSGTVQLCRSTANRLRSEPPALRPVDTLVDVSARLDPSWRVLVSPSTPSCDRCVDIFERPDGTFGFEEFRSDPEDMGRWTPIAYHSNRQFATEA